MGYLCGMVEAERGLHTTLSAALPSSPALSTSAS